MSDSSQTLVDLDVTAVDAPALGAAVRDWLLGRGIIRQATPSPEGPEYPPGPGYADAVAAGTDGSFLRLRHNGLRIHVGRRVFHAGGNGIELTCRACSTAFEPDEGWGDAASAWHGGQDDARFACPRCQQAERVVEWRGNWPWGFGHLGFEFWNWPPLTEEFLRATAQQVQHRILLVRCRL